jgi:hypothetical protein
MNEVGKTAPLDSERNVMDLNEFIDGGYLQEANRLFFHPLGIALCVMFEEKSGRALTLHSVWDSRDDPEGIAYGYEGDAQIDVMNERALKIWRERKAHAEARATLFGQEPSGDQFWDGVQPLTREAFGADKED